MFKIIIAANVQEELKEAVRGYIERQGDIVIFCYGSDLKEIMSKVKYSSIWIYDDSEIEIDVEDHKVQYFFEE